MSKNANAPQNVAGEPRRWGGENVPIVRQVVVKRVAVDEGHPAQCFGPRCGHVITLEGRHGQRAALLDRWRRVRFKRRVDGVALDGCTSGIVDQSGEF